jgi:GNAT superfamily N-acetyltransferase
MNGVGVDLRELTDANRDEVIGLRLAPGQGRFVSSVADSLKEAEENLEASPWYRAVYAGDEPVGFVMLSWNCVPRPPDIIGPWFLWKLLIDRDHQRRGYGRHAVRLVTDLIRAEGAEQLFVSCEPEGEGAPQPFYERLGFVPTGATHPDGEVILRLDLRT